MINKENFTYFFHHLYLYFLSLVFVFLFFKPKLVPISIAIFVLTSLVFIIKNKLKPKLEIHHFFIFLFFIYLLIGVVWSENKPMAWFDIEVKLSLFIFPILFLFIKPDFNELKILLKSFVIISFFSLMFYLVKSTGNFIETKNINSFIYTQLSDIIHPSYFSIYLNLSLIILLIDSFYLKNKIFKSFYLKLFLFFSIFLFNFLLLSKAGIVTSFLIILLYFIFNLSIRKKIIQTLFALLIIVFGVFSVYSYSTSSKQRIDELILGFSKNNEIKAQGSTSLRIFVWENAIELIKEKPIIGYGTGDVKDNLMRKYEEKDNQFAIQKKLNAHNQFLQVTISLGIIGLLIFLALLFIPLKSAFTNKNYFFIGFIFLMIFNFFTESVLENQAGTIFFGLFYGLFLNLKKHELT